VSTARTVPPVDKRTQKIPHSFLDAISCTPGTSNPDAEIVKLVKGRVAARVTDSRVTGPISSIACPPPAGTDCIAVGETKITTKPKPGANNFRGFAIRTAGGPRPAAAGVDAAALLHSVACPSARLCYAVGITAWADGMALPSSQGVIGTLRRGVPVRSQDIAGTVELNGIACPTKAICLAVGASTEAQDTAATVRIVKGKAKKPYLFPAADDRSQLNNVACLSKTFCYATGPQETSSYLELTKGRPAPSATLPFDVDTLTCPSKSECVFLGSSEADDATEVDTLNHNALDSRLITIPKAPSTQRNSLRSTGQRRTTGP
jgi:hypothetical protein